MLKSLRKRLSKIEDYILNCIYLTKII